MSKKRFVSLRWTASTTPNVEYIVYRMVSGGTWIRLNPITVGTTFNDSSVLPNRIYSYYVTAFDGTTESIPSNVFTVAISL